MCVYYLAAGLDKLAVIVTSQQNKMVVKVEGYEPVEIVLWRGRLKVNVQQTRSTHSEVNVMHSYKRDWPARRLSESDDDSRRQMNAMVETGFAVRLNCCQCEEYTSSGVRIVNDQEFHRLHESRDIVGYLLSVEAYLAGWRYSEESGILCPACAGPAAQEGTVTDGA